MRTTILENDSFYGDAQTSSKNVIENSFIWKLIGFCPKANLKAL